MFENLAPRKGLAVRNNRVSFSREMRGGFAFTALIPLIAAAISAIPGVASAIVEAKRQS